MAPILDLLTTLGALAAAFAGICALSTWRSQIIAERRAAIAEQLLSDAYAFQATFNAARSQNGFKMPKSMTFEEASSTPLIVFALEAARTAFRSENAEVFGRLNASQFSAASRQSTRSGRCSRSEWRLLRSWTS